MSEHDSQPDDLALQVIARELRALPRELPPRRPLWPEVEARISRVQQESAGPSRRAWMPTALAASVLLAVSALALSVHTSLRLQAASTPAVAESGAHDAALQAIESGYATAQLAYLRDLAARDSRLDGETRAVLQDNLRIIEAARSEIETALVEQPRDPLLLDALQSVRRTELEVLARLAGSRHTMI